eukprot:4076224-Amphidinium_carterae.7
MISSGLIAVGGGTGVGVVEDLEAAADYSLPSSLCPLSVIVSALLVRCPPFYRSSPDQEHTIPSLRVSAADPEVVMDGLRRWLALDGPFLSF